MTTLLTSNFCFYTIWTRSLFAYIHLGYALIQSYLQMKEHFALSYAAQSYTLHPGRIRFDSSSKYHEREMYFERIPLK